MPQADGQSLQTQLALCLHCATPPMSLKTPKGVPALTPYC